MKSTFAIIFLLLLGCQSNSDESMADLGGFVEQYLTEEQQSVIRTANFYLEKSPTPITLFRSERSSGGKQDFYSEGDYWWPDPDNPKGPYIRKDGLTNPENFTAHRKAMRDLNRWVSTLVAAFEITQDEKYALHAISHLKAFFLDTDTAMNPNLLFAQAIQGRHTGRGIGIIDTIHLIEVARCIKKLKAAGKLNEQDFIGLKTWFLSYSTWMNSHQYGLDEKDHGNNHSTWWAAQIAAFADLTENEEHRNVARIQFKKLLDLQMDQNGRFPDELSRTKPYNYTLFNLEGYAVICALASDSENDLWNYQSQNGSLKKAWDFMIPYIKEKEKWIKPPDVSHFDEIPIQSVGLLLAGLAYEDEEYLRVWKNLSSEKKSEEVIRNFPLWHPQNWI